MTSTSSSSIGPPLAFFFFFFELGVYCPLRKQQDMMVQLSVTSYGYHLATQE